MPNLPTFNPRAVSDERCRSTQLFSTVRKYDLNRQTAIVTCFRNFQQDVIGILISLT